MSSDPEWLRIGRRLLSLAHNGLSFPGDKYDKERFAELREIAVDVMARFTDLERSEVLRVYERELGYMTPRIDVRGACFEGDRVLLVREIMDEGRWTLPGGWADVNDAPSQAVEREVREESGYEAKATKLVAVWERSRHHPPHPVPAYKLFFLCEITGGAPRHSIETDGVGFFSLDELPPLSLGRTTRWQLERLLAHKRRPELPTEFD